MENSDPCMVCSSWRWTSWCWHQLQSTPKVCSLSEDPTYRFLMESELSLEWTGYTNRACPCPRSFHSWHGSRHVECEMNMKSTLLAFSISCAGAGSFCVSPRFRTTCTSKGWNFSLTWQIVTGYKWHWALPSIYRSISSFCTRKLVRNTKTIQERPDSGTWESDITLPQEFLDTARTFEQVWTEK